jgi:hypothetical protein
MPEIGTSGLMSGDGKRGDGQRPQATAPILDSTARKGQAIHTQSDFMRPLYEWGDALFANAVRI